MKTILLLSFVLILSACAASPTQDTTSTNEPVAVAATSVAKQALTQAREQYNQKNYEAALKLFQEAAENADKDGLSEEDKARALFSIGATMSKNEYKKYRAPEAYQAFRKAFPDSSNPTVQQKLKEARRRTECSR
jgi:tetratricopeptide (TPR) repeat protein